MEWGRPVLRPAMASDGHAVREAVAVERARCLVGTLGLTTSAVVGKLIPQNPLPGKGACKNLRPKEPVCQLYAMPIKTTTS
jgi:hypothetical protein